MSKNRTKDSCRSENDMHHDGRNLNAERSIPRTNAITQQQNSFARHRCNGLMQISILASITAIAIIASSAADAEGQVIINVLTGPQARIRMALETNEWGDCLVVGFHTNTTIDVRPCAYHRPPIVSATGVGDDTLALLSHFVHVEDVSLDGGAFSDEAIANLSHLENIEVLSLRDTGIGDNAIEHLLQLEKLQELDLGGNRISDVGLQYIIQLEHLWRLDLTSALITDEGLMQLSEMAELLSLELGNTQVSTEAIQRLEQALPQLRISRESYSMGR